MSGMYLVKIERDNPLKETSENLIKPGRLKKCEGFKQVGRFGDAIWQVCPQLVLTPCIENTV